MSTQTPITTAVPLNIATSTTNGTNTGVIELQAPITNLSIDLGAVRGPAGPPGPQGPPGESPDLSAYLAFVSHGADANLSRPAVSGPVMWDGSVRPVNMAVNDLWISTV